MTTQTFVIVGGGLAGAGAAAELRGQGFDGRVTLIGAEPELPYERPPLSKDYLRGESPREQSQVHPQAFYAEQEIELLSGCAVAGVDAERARVTLEDGRELAYDRLLLAPGCEPRQLSIPGAELENVCYLRTLADCDRLRARLAAGGPIVVIGAGWIGCEVAASARQGGAEVTIVEPAAVPLERVLGAELGAMYRDVHRDHGVELLLGTGVSALEGAGAVERVRTSDGRTLECATVVVGIGVTPRVELATGAGLRTDNGILVDSALATSAPGVFAAGDVAHAWHPFYGERIRIEHWANALHQGPAAARSMLGQPVSFERLPYFYSDQYDVGMEYSGYATRWDEVVFRGDPATREFIAFWLADGLIVAGMNVNVWDVNEHVQALIRARIALDVGRLTDPDTPLEELLPATSGADGGVAAP